MLVLGGKGNDADLAKNKIVCDKVAMAENVWGSFERNLINTLTHSTPDLSRRHHLH
jgi:hypothetical protein